MKVNKRRLTVLLAMVMTLALTTVVLAYPSRGDDYSVPYSIDDGRSGNCMLRISDKKCYTGGTHVRELPYVTGCTWRHTPYPSYSQWPNDDYVSSISCTAERPDPPAGGGGGGDGDEDYVPRPPRADFDWSPKPAYPGDSVTFIDLSSPGDGTITSRTFSPRSPQVYDRPGSYSVTLTVRDINGLSDSRTRSVTIEHERLRKPPGGYFIGPGQREVTASNPLPRGFRKYALMGTPGLKVQMCLDGNLHPGGRGVQIVFPASSDPVWPHTYKLNPLPGQDKCFGLEIPARFNAVYKDGKHTATFRVHAYGNRTVDFPVDFWVKGQWNVDGGSSGSRGR